MKDFVGRKLLGRLDPGARAVYTSFLVFAAAGLLSAALLHADGMGTGADGALYWRGDEAQGLYPKSYRQLLELTHFHLFTEPVLLLIVAHLYNLGSEPPPRRVFVTAALVLAIAGQLALPWLTVYGSAAFGLGFLPVHATLLLSILYMVLRSLWEMWAPDAG